MAPAAPASAAGRAAPARSSPAARAPACYGKGAGAAALASGAEGGALGEVFEEELDGDGTRDAFADEHLAEIDLRRTAVPSLDTLY